MTSNSPSPPKAVSLQHHNAHAVRIEATGIEADAAISAVDATSSMLREIVAAVARDSPSAPPPDASTEVSRAADGTYSVTVELRYNPHMDPRKHDLGSIAKASAELSARRQGAAVRQGGPDIKHPEKPKRPPKKPRPPNTPKQGASS